MKTPTPYLPIADALRLIRTRKRLTQTAASKLTGAPDFRTLSHWETRRKQPSFRLLTRYLTALGLDLHDLQDALDQVDRAPSSTAKQLAELGDPVEQLAGQVEQLADGRTVAGFVQALGTLAKRVDKLERLPKRVGKLERPAGVDQARQAG